MEQNVDYKRKLHIQVTLFKQELSNYQYPKHSFYFFFINTDSEYEKSTISTNILKIHRIS